MKVSPWSSRSTETPSPSLCRSIPRPPSVTRLERLRDAAAIVPPIWAAEVANALVVAQRRGRVTESQIAELIDSLCGLPIETVSDTSMAGRVTTVSRHSLSAYGAGYLDIASRRGLPLATFDERLRNAAAAIGVSVLPPAQHPSC